MTNFKAVYGKQNIRNCLRNLKQMKYVKLPYKFVLFIEICNIFYNKFNFQSFFIHDLSMLSILSLGSTIVSSAALTYIILFNLPCLKGEERGRNLSTGALHRQQPQSPPTAIRDVHPHRCRPLKQPQGQSWAAH